MGGENMYELFKEFIKPELLVLVPVLYIVGIFIKRSAMPDYKIPIVLGVIGVFLAMLWLFATCDIHGLKCILLAIFTGITQGVLVAGASVYINQIAKQTKEQE